MRRGQRSAHGAMSLLMTAAIALTLIAAFMFKQDPASAPPPERLDGGDSESAAAREGAQ